MGNPHPKKTLKDRPNDINRKGQPKIPQELKVKTIENRKRLVEIYEKWTYCDFTEFQYSFKQLSIITTKINRNEELSTEEKEFIDKFTTLDVYVIKLLGKGIGQGDGRIEYLFNRIYGRPKEEIHHEIKKFELVLIKASNETINQ
jgi:hypothetical protein